MMLSLCSGNTWLRAIIKQTTGFYTGSVYRDGELYRAGFLGEFEKVLSGRAMVIKTHLSKQRSSELLFKGTVRSRIKSKMEYLKRR